MYWYLQGTLLHIDGNTLTLKIEGTGLGYNIISSPSLLSQALVGTTIEIWIHHHRTEVSEILFWFLNARERSLFRELIKVSGIGGKTAITMLGLGEEALIRAIQLEDDKLLSSVPWIGKKTAQKIIVDLKGSIDFSQKNTEKASDIASSSHDTLLVSSLVGMGYDKFRVESIVGHIDSTLSLQERTIQAIRELAKP